MPRMVAHLRKIDNELQQHATEVLSYNQRHARNDAIMAQFLCKAEAVTATQTTVRAMQRDAPKAIEIAAASPPPARLIDPQSEVVPELLWRRDPPRSFNLLPIMTDYDRLGRKQLFITCHVESARTAQAMGLVSPNASSIDRGSNDGQWISKIGPGERLGQRFT